MTSPHSRQPANQPGALPFEAICTHSHGQPLAAASSRRRGLQAAAEGGWAAHQPCRRRRRRRCGTAQAAAAPRRRQLWRRGGGGGGGRAAACCRWRWRCLWLRAHHKHPAAAWRPCRSCGWPACRPAAGAAGARRGRCGRGRGCCCCGATPGGQVFTVGLGALLCLASDLPQLHQCRPCLLHHAHPPAPPFPPWSMHRRYQGVCLCGNNRRWQAQVTFKRKRHYLGMHASEEAAARAYDQGAICLLVSARLGVACWPDSAPQETAAGLPFSYLFVRVGWGWGWGWLAGPGTGDMSAGAGRQARRRRQQTHTQAHVRDACKGCRSHARPATHPTCPLLLLLPCTRARPAGHPGPDQLPD